MTTERERTEMDAIRARRSNNETGSTTGTGPQGGRGVRLPSTQHLELLYRRFYPKLCKYGYMLAGASYLLHLVWFGKSHGYMLIGVGLITFMGYRYKVALSPQFKRTSTLGQLIIGFLIVTTMWNWGFWMAVEPISAVVLSGAVLLCFKLTGIGRWIGARSQHVKGAKEDSARLAFNEHKIKIDRWIAEGKHPPEYVNFAGMPLTTLEATTHFLLIGETRSGKSLLMSMMLPALLYQNKRAIIYDYANNFLGKLVALGIPQNRIVNLNPFHRECTEWLLSEDLTNQSQ